VRPLEGMRVIALEHAVAAPLCSRHLADLGADVIKVERPGGGDFARDYDNYVNGICSHFIWLNRGKRSITLDVKQPGGRDVLAKLIDGADVLLQNLAPGAAARLGLREPQASLGQHARRRGTQLASRLSTAVEVGVLRAAAVPPPTDFVTP